MLHHHGARYCASNVAHQVLKQRVFALAELDRFAGALNHVALRIKHQVADFKGLRRLLGASQKSLHPRQQFLKRKWLNEVVIRAGLQSRHAISNFPPAAQDQHASSRPGLPQFSQERKTIHARQVPVQNNTVVTDFGRQFQALFPVFCQIHGEVLRFKAFRQAAGNLGFVFNNQDAHVPPSASGRPPGEGQFCFLAGWP